MTEFDEEKFIRTIRKEEAVGNFLTFVRGIIKRLGFTVDDAIQTAGVPDQYVEAVRERLNVETF